MLKRSVAALLMGVVVAGVAFAGDWPHWRGPEMNGISRETGLVEKWSPEGENLLWQNDVGGMSSPIVLNNRVYVMGRSGEVLMEGEEGFRTLVSGQKTQETVVCVDAETGKVLWRHAENVTQSDAPFHRLGWSSVSGDPETGNVYALFVHNTFVCLNGETGKVLWRKQLTEDQGIISTYGGRTATPTVDGDQVLVGYVSFGWGDHSRGQHRLYAFDKKTGAINWASATGAPPVDTSMTTPIIAVVDGVRLVITVAGDGGVHAFKVGTGEKVWSHKVSKRGLNTTPIVVGTRLLVAHSEENLDAERMGRMLCLDISGKEPKELWRADAVEAGFATGVAVDGVWYQPDNAGVLHAYDIDTGKSLWTRRMGRIGRPSVVYADGKLYTGEANGYSYVFKLKGRERPEQLSKVEITDKLGREYALFGSPAISNGRIFVMSATNMYAIGEKGRKVEATLTPAVDSVGTYDANAKPSFVLVTPSDVTLRAGEKVQFVAKAFDEKGRPLGEKKGTWSLGQLSIGAAPSVQTTQPGAAAPATPPPVKVGNLGGAVDESGTYTAAGEGTQVGAVVADVGGVKGNARVRVLPALPWSIDFEKYPVEKPPLTWVGAGGKFTVRDAGGQQGQSNKVLVKTTDNDLYARARTNFGSSDMSGYTLEADVRTGSQTIADQRQMPDIGIINSKYVLVLMGNHQRAQLHTWSTELPDERKPSGSLNRTISYAWEPDTWYRLKLRVDQQEGKALVRGKVWPVGKNEPAEWTLQMTDEMPNKSGSPGVYGNSLVGAAKSEIWYDNVVVTKNEETAK